MSEPRESTGPGAALFVLFGFISSLVACTVVFQLMSDVPPWEDDSPIDFFTSGVLWMVSLVCLLQGMKCVKSAGRSVFWIACCAAFGLLAVDESFAFHEATADAAGDDDHVKVLAWIVAGVTLYLIWRLERPGRVGRAGIVAAYLFHTFYLLVDVGDGDFFRLPLAPIGALKWSEEFFELLCVSSLLLAFVSVYTDTQIRAQVGDAHAGTRDERKIRNGERAAGREGS